MTNKYYSDLCIRAITGNLSENERVALDQWLNKSEENQKEFEQIKNLWNRIAETEQNSLTKNEIDIEWEKLNYRIMNDVRSSGFEVKWYESIFNWLFKPLYKPAIAAGTVIIILSLVYFLQLKDEPIPTISVSTNAGEKKELTLSDGSSVVLNYQSNIQYPKEFSETREVILNGEAFFSVIKNAKQFRVKTVNAIVTVLGTKFAIKTNETKTNIFVKEGKVNLKQLNSKDNGTKISAGQRSVVLNNMLPSAPKNVNADDALSWLNDVLTFSGTPMYEIKSELEKLYGISIIITEEEINYLTLTGSFRFNTPIDSVLDMVCLAFELKHEKQSDKYVISTK